MIFKVGTIYRNSNKAFSIKKRGSFSSLNSFFSILIFLLFTFIILHSSTHLAHGRYEVNIPQKVIRGPLVVRRMLGEDVFQSQENGIDLNFSFPENYSEKLGAIVKKFEDQRKTDDLTVGVIRANHFLISTVLEIGLGSVASSLGFPVGQIFSKVVSSSLNQVIQLIESDLRVTTQNRLANMLENYRQETNDSAFQSFNSLSPEELFLLLNQYESSVYSNELNGISEEGRAIANGFLLKTLQDQVVLNEIKNRIIDQNQSQQIQENSEKMAQLSERYSQINRTMTEFFESMQVSQKTILEAFEAISEYTVENRGFITENREAIIDLQGDVGNLQVLAFLNMTATQKLEVFEQGLLDRNMISKADYERLEIESFKEKLVENVSIFLENTGYVVSTINDLNVVIDLPEDLVQGVNVAYTVMSSTGQIAAGIASKNPLMILAGVASLFRLFDDSDDNLRETMEAVFENQKELAEAIQTLAENQVEIVETFSENFETLFENQGKIVESITELAQNQNVLFQNQQKLFTSFNNFVTHQSEVNSDLNARIEEYRRQFLIYYDRLNTRLSHFRSMTRSLMDQDFRNCIDIVEALQEEKRNHLNRPLSYSQYSKVFNGHVLIVKRCFNGILQRTSTNIKVDDYFLLESYIDEPLFSEVFSFPVEEVGDFLTQVYNPALFLFLNNAHILFENFDQNQDSDQVQGQDFFQDHLQQDFLQVAIQELAKPSGNFLSLEMKLSSLPSQEAKIQIHPTLMGKYIASLALIRNLPYILEIYPFLSLVNPSTYELPIRELLLENLSNESYIHRQEGLVVLERLKKIVTISRAQQNLISGNLLLPILHAILLNSNHPHFDRAKALIKSSGLESPLVKNLALYILKKALNHNSYASSSHEVSPHDEIIPHNEIIPYEFSDNRGNSPLYYNWDEYKRAYYSRETSQMMEILNRNYDYDAEQFESLQNQNEENENNEQSIEQSQDENQNQESTLVGQTEQPFQEKQVVRVNRLSENFSINEFWNQDDPESFNPESDLFLEVNGVFLELPNVEEVIRGEFIHAQINSFEMLTVLDEKIHNSILDTTFSRTLSDEEETLINGAFGLEGSFSLE